MARRKNSRTSGAHTAPFSICGQLLVPIKPARPKARPEIREAARDRLRSVWCFSATCILGHDTLKSLRIIGLPIGHESALSFALERVFMGFTRYLAKTAVAAVALFAWTALAQFPQQQPPQGPPQQQQD